MKDWPYLLRNIEAGEEVEEERSLEQGSVLLCLKDQVYLTAQFFPPAPHLLSENINHQLLKFLVSANRQP